MQRFAIYVILFGLTASLAMLGQYGGQGPIGNGPLGQGPMGQGPMGGGGIPIPHRHKKGQQDSSTKDTQPTLSADGKTVSNDGKTLVVNTKDGRTLTLRLNDRTKFTHSGTGISAGKIVPGTTVRVEAAEDQEAYLTATSVDLVKDAPASAPASAHGGTPAAGAVPQPANPDGTAPDEEDAELTRPTILNSPDAPNRPILRHGRPRRSTASATADDDSSAPDASAKPKPKPVAARQAADDNGSSDFTIGENTGSAPRSVTPKRDALLDRTREWAQTFTNGLPNFVCEQMTTRYMEVSRSAGWEAHDVVAAKVVYEDGRESYKDISIDGHKTSKSMLEIGGATSTGEFASVLRSLLADRSGAQFKFYRSDSIAGTPAAVYDFKVPLQLSDWTITIGGQSLRPAYSGSIWVDRKTAEVRRIEMQADNIPQDFPSDSVQMAVDYDSVPLGTSKFLLPVHAENLSCQRGSPVCSKNAIDFRNYHKFSGESTITFGK
ncbi:MAG TPA: hypothetical protein VLJ11_00690 [Bryobacteraceae bacterium]|nr:hypothetical protein [Bryobacteraceae bacterium]